MIVLRDKLEEVRVLSNQEASKNGHENRGIKRKIEFEVEILVY